MDKARRVVGALMLAAPLVAEFGYMLVHGAKLALIVCGSVLGGYFELPDSHHERGRLTWYGVNGKVVAPEYVRRARTIKKLGESA